MNTEHEIIVASIIQAAGGRLVSRIRLQKTAYLLEQLGAKSGFKYTYHHYGPYSREIDSAIEDAKAFGYIKEEISQRRSDGASYSIFTINSERTVSNTPLNNYSNLVESWTKEPILILELAATAHWLYVHEKVGDWKKEIQRRKGAKTEEGRLEKALGILRDIKLPPAV